MVQWVKKLTAEPEDLSLIPGTHMVKNKNKKTLIPKYCLLTSMHTCQSAHIYAHMLIHTHA